MRRKLAIVLATVLPVITFGALLLTGVADVEATRGYTTTTVGAVQCGVDYGRLVDVWCYVGTDPTQA